MGAREAIVLCIIYSETVVNNRISQVGERVGVRCPEENHCTTDALGSNG